MPVSQQHYAENLMDILDLIDAQKESNMLLKRDMFQLGTALQNIEKKTCECKEKSNIPEDLAFG